MNSLKWYLIVFHSVLPRSKVYAVEQDEKAECQTE